MKKETEQTQHGTWTGWEYHQGAEHRSWEVGGTRVVDRRVGMEGWRQDMQWRRGGAAGAVTLRERNLQFSGAASLSRLTSSRR